MPHVNHLVKVGGGKPLEGMPHHGERQERREVLDLGEGEADLARRRRVRHLVAGHIDLGGVEPDHGERPEGAGGLRDGAVDEAVRPVVQEVAQGLAAGSAAGAAAPKELLAHQGDPPPAFEVHPLSFRHLLRTYTCNGFQFSKRSFVS